MSALLEARDVTFAYDRRPVVRGAVMSLTPGEIVTLIGPNGSGKSTLIRLLLGQLHGSGSIAWKDRPIASWHRRELAKVIAYLPQNPTCETGQRVMDVLRLGRVAYWGAFGIESQRDVTVVDDVAGMLGLSDLLRRRMDEISGGQRQRVFIGRCLVQEPRAMLLDEPSTFLDLKHQVEILQLLRRLGRERGIGVLMASHDLNLAGLFADRLVLLDDGVIAAEGAAAIVLDPTLLSRVYGVQMRRIETAEGTIAVLPAL